MIDPEVEERALSAVARLTSGRAESATGVSRKTVIRDLAQVVESTPPKPPEWPPDDPGPPEPPAETETDIGDRGKGDKSRKSVAVQLVELTRADYALGVTDDDRPFGVNTARPHIALMLRGGKTGLRAEVARRYFADHNVVPSQQALADACMVLEGYAAQETPQQVHLRVAEDGGAVYVDMGDTAGRVIEISGGAWKIVDTAPVLFRRTKLTGALPYPHPGELTQLWEFVPIAEADRPVLLAFLVAALVQADVPHPVLALLAEQGSAKSTITRFLVDLLDPSPVPLRKPPRDADSWVTAASASWVVALDNLSGTPPAWLSDSLCRASTGDGDVRRQLYTDDDVAPFSFRRVVIVNGIDFAPGPEQGDLAERLVVVDLRRPSIRRREDDLAEDWRQKRPQLLGALFQLAAQVHYRLPAVEINDMPRMADFAAVLAAVDEILGTAGMERYRERSKRIAADTLDAPFVAELVERRASFTDATSAHLLGALKPADVDWKQPRDWPKNARAVTGQLTRHAPALRAQGWTVDSGRNRDKVTTWTIYPPKPETAGIDDPQHPQHPQNSHTSTSEHADGCGSTCGSETQHTAPITRTDPQDPHLDMPLTCNNGSAGVAGHQYAPSQVIEQGRLFMPPTGPGRCGDCGCHIETQGHKPDCTAIEKETQP